MVLLKKYLITFGDQSYGLIGTIDRKAIDSKN